MSTFNVDYVFPGDKISAVNSSNHVTLVGPGLYRSEENVNSLYATRSGVFRHSPPNLYWVESRQQRYVPKKGDLVVGIVAKKSGDSLRIDIGSSEHATLSTLAFEGATKKLKPDVQVGDAVYCRVLSAHRQMEPELVCVDSYYKAGKLGILANEGFIFGIGLNLVYKLLGKDCVILETLGKKFAYEIAIGMNGKVWVNGKDVKNVIKVVKTLQAFDSQSDYDINQLCLRY